MNQFSRKDKKFLVALMFIHFSFVFMAISFFGLYYKGQVNECVRLNKKLELGEWAEGEVNKVKAEHQLESMKKGYNNQGISAEEY